MSRSQEQDYRRGTESDPFACKSRKEWLVDACKAFIACTTPAHRYMFVKEGFLPFQKMAGPMFKEFAGLHFSNSEVRLIYDMLRGWTQFKEAHLWPFLEMAFEETRRRSWKADEEPTADDRDNDVVETERVHRGVAEKKAYKGRMRIQ